MKHSAPVKCAAIVVPVLRVLLLLPQPIKFEWEVQKFWAKPRQCLIAQAFDLMRHMPGPKGHRTKSMPDRPIMQKIRVNSQVKTFVANYRQLPEDPLGLV